MWKDPIVEKIHRYREAYAKKFNYDVWAIYEDMKIKQKQQELEGWRFVSRCATDTQEKEESSETVNPVK
jgi:hypothetical protein